MLWQTLGIEQWFVAVAVLSGFVGRVLKGLWKTMPSWVLPTVVLTFSYLLVFGDLAIDDRRPLDVDARWALWALFAGGTAIGGHELAKKILVFVGTKVLGLIGKSNAEERAEAIAEWLLGKLREKAEKDPPSGKRSTLPLLVLCLALLPGCAALGPALSALEAFSATAQHAQRLGSAIAAADAGADAYFARHPNPESRAEVTLALKRARAALMAYDAAAQAAGDAADGDLGKARTEALRAFGALRDLLGAIGVLAGTSEGGAESEAPDPGPLELPTVAELEVR